MKEERMEIFGSDWHTVVLRINRIERSAHLTLWSMDAAEDECEIIDFKYDVLHITALIKTLRKWDLRLVR